MLLFKIINIKIILICYYLIYRHSFIIVSTTITHIHILLVIDNVFVKLSQSTFILVLHVNVSEMPVVVFEKVIV